jgi:hypothetical protein
MLCPKLLHAVCKSLLVKRQILQRLYTLAALKHAKTGYALLQATAAARTYRAILGRTDSFRVKTKERIAGLTVKFI